MQCSGTHLANQDRTGDAGLAAHIPGDFRGVNHSIRSGRQLGRLHRSAATHTPLHASIPQAARRHTHAPGLGQWEAQHVDSGMCHPARHIHGRGVVGLRFGGGIGVGVGSVVGVGWQGKTDAWSVRSESWSSTHRDTHIHMIYKQIRRSGPA